MKSLFVFYGILISALLLLFQLSKFWLFGSTMASEFFTVLIALVSIIIGVYLGKNKSNKSKKSNTNEAFVDEKARNELQISDREYEVLGLLSKGLSNKEIAESLFLSESTIKTHVSNLLFKLEVKQRTKAVVRAKELNIIC